MAHPNEDLVREGYEAFGRGDIEALQSRFFAPDIRWHFPGRSPFAGDYTGVAEVLGWLGRSAEASGGTLRVELHDVIGNDEHVVALVNVRAERGARGWTTTRSRCSMSGTAKQPRSGLIRPMSTPRMTSGPDLVPAPDRQAGSGRQLKRPGPGRWPMSVARCRMVRWRMSAGRISLSTPTRFPSRRA